MEGACSFLYLLYVMETTALSSVQRTSLNFSLFITFISKGHLRGRMFCSYIQYQTQIIIVGL